MEFVGDRFFLVAIAMLVDAVVGDPRRLWDRVPHPAVLIGTCVDWLDRNLNNDDDPPEARRRAGFVAAAAVAVGGYFAGRVLGLAVDILPFSWWLEVAVVAILLAGRSLYDHVDDVAAALEAGGLAHGRAAVRHIVGRDPEDLDEAGVARASIESLAENFSDGVVAPVFWYAVLGLPGLVAYKAVNTADSMIGHRTPRYNDFGRATARLDDVLNWLPARATGGLIAVAAQFLRKSGDAAFRVMRQDAGRHRSVNAGWPEAAMAGALGIRLAGPRAYGGALVDDAVMNPTGRDARIGDIREGLKLYVGANVALAGVLGMTSLVI